jgi:hypothetical protein
MKSKTLILNLFIVVFCLLITENGFSQNKKKAEDPDEIKKPIMNYAEWTGTDDNALYKNCIISLHMANIDIDPVRTGYGKDIGLIVSDSVKYKIPTDFRASYRLSVIVFKTMENKMALHIIVNNPKILIRSQYVGKYTINGFNNIIAADIEKFISQLEILQGKALTTRTTAIDIQYNGL